MTASPSAGGQRRTAISRPARQSLSQPVDAPCCADMADNAAVYLQGHVYSLRLRPAPTSPLVVAARKALLLDLAPDALSADAQRLFALLSTIESPPSAIAAPAAPATATATATAKAIATAKSTATPASSFRHDDDAPSLTDVAKHALRTTIRTLRAARRTAHATLSDQAHAHDALRQRQTTAFATILQTSDARARTVSTRLAHAVDLQTATSRRLAHAITATHTHLAHHHATSRRLATSLVSARAARSQAWLAHGAVLESLACAGRQYTRCARAERSAARRAVWARAARTVATWAESMLPVRRTAARVRRSTREALVSAGAAQREKRALMALKVELRLRNRTALTQVSQSARDIARHGKRATVARRAARAEHERVERMRSANAIVMRMAALCAQLQAELEPVSRNHLVEVVAHTCPEVSDGAAGETVDAVKLVAHDWVPGMAVRRLMLGYYARWATIADVCDECLGSIGNKALLSLLSLEAEECDKEGDDNEISMDENVDTRKECEMDNVGRRIEQLLCAVDWDVDD